MPRRINLTKANMELGNVVRYVANTPEVIDAISGQTHDPGAVLRGQSAPDFQLNPLRGTAKTRARFARADTPDVRKPPYDLDERPISMEIFKVK